MREILDIFLLSKTALKFQNIYIFVNTDINLRIYLDYVDESFIVSLCKKEKLIKGQYKIIKKSSLICQLS